MELEKKIELMKQSYFSGYYADGDALDAGILYFEIENLSSEKGESGIKRLKDTFKEFEHNYNEVVPFYEITQEMTTGDWDDFAILFRVREVLPKVKIFIDEFTTFLRENNYYASNDSDMRKRYAEIRKEWRGAEEYDGKTFCQHIQKYVQRFGSTPAQLPE